MKHHYLILKAYTTEGLEREVMRYLGMHWHLVGGASPMQKNDWYMQALEKVETLEPVPSELKENEPDANSGS